MYRDEASSDSAYCSQSIVHSTKCRLFRRRDGRKSVNHLASTEGTGEGGGTRWRGGFLLHRGWLLHRLRLGRRGGGRHVHRRGPSIVRPLNSDTEISSLGTGLHVIAEGSRSDDTRFEETCPRRDTSRCTTKAAFRSDRRRVRGLHVGREKAHSRPRGAGRCRTTTCANARRSLSRPVDAHNRTGFRRKVDRWTLERVRRGRHVKRKYALAIK